jgi:hypothetical protein
MRLGERARVWVRRRAERIALAALALSVGCGGDDLPFAARRASEVRELDFQQDVTVVTMTRAAFRAQADARAAQIDDADLRELADTYGRLGFFSLDLDLRPILAGSATDFAGATYSPQSKTITLVGESPEDVEASTEVHEYVHALQDQHFDLSEFNGSTSDEFLARRAVVEGDAVLAEARFLAQEEVEGDLHSWSWPQLLESWHTFGRDLLASSPYPVFFVDYPSFVYPFGLEFTATNLLGGDFAAPPPHEWGLEDELFTERPPVTAQQVARRELEADPGEPIGLDAVPAGLDGRLEAIDWDTLGQWYAYLLFYQLLSVEALELASLWEGDRVLFVSDSARDGAVATVWASSWSDATTAEQVAAALASLFSFTPSDDPPQAGTALDGETLWIERRDRRVVAIKNLDPELAPTVADAAFDPPAAQRARRSRLPIALRLRQLLH